MSSGKQTLLRQVRVALYQPPSELKRKELRTELAARLARPELGFLDEQMYQEWRIVPENPNSTESAGLIVGDSGWLTKFRHAIRQGERQRIVAVGVQESIGSNQLQTLEKKKGWAPGSRQWVGHQASRLAEAAAEAVADHRTRPSGVLLWIIDDDRSRFDEGGVWFELWHRLTAKEDVTLLPSWVTEDCLEEPGELLKLWRDHLILRLRELGTPLVVITDNQFRPAGRFGRLGERLALLVSATLPNARVLLASNEDDGRFLPRRVECLDLMYDPHFRVSPDGLEAVQAALHAAREAGPLPIEPERQWSRRLGELYGESAAMQPVYEQAEKAMKTEAVQTLLGEPGTGKTELAQTIHDGSQRRKERMEPVDLGAISPGLFVSELFGHRRGSFTGAVRDSEGSFARADGSTIFLDEIGNVPLEHQQTLLRAIDLGVISPVGRGETPFPVDVRVIAATNSDLRKEVEDGNFRKDLLGRLDVEFAIRLPPLRDRGDDVLLIAERLHGARLSEVAERWLLSHDWPSNVRTLKAAVRRLREETMGADRLARGHGQGKRSFPRGDGLAAPFHALALMWSPLAERLGPDLLVENREDPGALYERVVGALNGLIDDLDDEARARAKVLLGWTRQDKQVEEWLDRTWRRTCRTTGLPRERPTVRGERQIWTALLVGAAEPSTVGVTPDTDLGKLFSRDSIVQVARDWCPEAREGWSGEWSKEARAGLLVYFLFDVWDAYPRPSGRSPAHQVAREAGKRLFTHSGASVNGLKVTKAQIRDLFPDLDRVLGLRSKQRGRSAADTWTRTRRTAELVVVGAQDAAAESDRE